MFVPNKVQIFTFLKKRSKFISIIKPLDNVFSFRSWLSQIKKDYYNASHFCWSYRIYIKDEIQEDFSDAGEPRGTAGRSIIKVLKETNLVNCAIIVIRYFGGVKLGKRGLIDSYYEAASGILINLKLSDWQKKELYVLNCEIKYYHIIMRLFSSYKIKIIEDKSLSSSCWLIYIVEKELGLLQKKLLEVTNSNISIKKIKNK